MRSLAALGLGSREGGERSLTPCHPSHPAIGTDLRSSSRNCSARLVPFIRMIVIDIQWQNRFVNDPSSRRIHFTRDRLRTQEGQAPHTRDRLCSSGEGRGMIVDCSSGKGPATSPS